MAKASYFGKFDGINSVMQAQQALDQGLLLKPFVAIYSVDYNESVHYDDLDTVDAGVVQDIPTGEVSWLGDSLQFTVVSGQLYWMIEDNPDWISFSQSSGTPDYNPAYVDFDISENDGMSSRSGSFKVVFYYDSGNEYIRNTVTVTIEQGAATIEPGYVTDGNDPVTALTASYSEGTVGYLYGQSDGDKPLFWVAESDADWLFFWNTSAAWTDSGEPTEIYAYQNPNESSRSTNITFSFYLDDEMQNLYNTVVIPFTQEGQVFEDGYFDPDVLSGITYGTHNTRSQVVADGLYWEITYGDWITGCNPNPSQGNQRVYFYFGNNRATERTTTATINFYLDAEHTVFKNSDTITITQNGSNRDAMSWNPDYYQDITHVSSDSGSTTLYNINHPNNYYFVVNGPVESYSGTPETSAITVNYGENTQYDGENLSIEVLYYFDSAYQSLATQYGMSLYQNGNPDAAHLDILNNYVQWTGGTCTAEIYLGNNGAVTWELDLESANTSFPDYPGENPITGDSSVTAVTIEVANNKSIEFMNYNVDVKFYDGNGVQIGQTNTKNIAQEPGQFGIAYFTENYGQSVSVGGRWTGDIEVTIEPASGYYYDLQDGSGNTITTGDTTASTTAITISSANLGPDPIEYTCYCKFCSDPELTNEVGVIELVATQEVASEEVCFECSFVTTNDNETKNVASGGGMLEFNSAYLDGGANIANDIQYDGNGHFTYTFASAGTHVITLTRENDPYLQEWLNNTDMYSFSGHSTTLGWGFHSDVFSGSTNLTSMTLDEHCDQYGPDSFNGLSNLILINMYRLNDSAYSGGSFPYEITDHPGTLHIPSGTTGDYQNVITGLGNNWTVVDDL